MEAGLGVCGLLGGGILLGLILPGGLGFGECFVLRGDPWRGEVAGLDVQQAVPLGLIVNETLTNSFKYAFPFSGEDKITLFRRYG